MLCGDGGLGAHAVAHLLCLWHGNLVAHLEAQQSETQAHGSNGQLHAPRLADPILYNHQFQNQLDGSRGRTGRGGV